MARCLLLSFHAVTAFPPWMTLPVVPTQWGTEVPSGYTFLRGLRQSHLATSLMLRPRAAGINRNLEKFSKINYCGFCGGGRSVVRGRPAPRVVQWPGTGLGAGIREDYRENSGNDRVSGPHPPAEAGSPRLDTCTYTDNLVIRCRLEDRTDGRARACRAKTSPARPSIPPSACCDRSDLRGAAGNVPRLPRGAVAFAERLRLADVPGDEGGCRGNAARCAVELAVLDAYGRRFGAPLPK